MGQVTLPVRLLFCLCTEESTPALWEELVRRTQPIVRATLRSACGRYPEARSWIVQRLMDQTDSILYSYLKAIAIHVTIDLIRRQRAARRNLGIFRGPLPNSTSPPETWAFGGDRVILLREIDHILTRSDASRPHGRNRLIFWLYYREGLTSKAIASIPAMELTAKGVDSVLHRVAQLVRKELNPPAARIPTPPAGLKSIESRCRPESRQ